MLSVFPIHTKATQYTISKAASYEVLIIAIALIKVSVALCKVKYLFECSVEFNCVLELD